MFDWIITKLGTLFGSKYSKSIARTLAAVVAGVLLKAGIPEEVVTQFTLGLEPVIAGLIIYLLAQAASFLDKFKNQPSTPKVVR